jgi:DNA polymerase zeta
MCNISLQAINLIHSTDRWRARVVYGDTDSLFIHLPGRSKDQAFLIGNEIADAVTARNPKPMKLKFEKVRCFLRTVTDVGHLADPCLS